MKKKKGKINLNCLPSVFLICVFHHLIYLQHIIKHIIWVLGDGAQVTFELLLFCTFPMQYLKLDFLYL